MADRILGDFTDGEQIIVTNVTHEQNMRLKLDSDTLMQVFRAKCEYISFAVMNRNRVAG